MSTSHKYNSKLAGKTVLLIGGSSGIGFGIAEACIENQVYEIIISSAKDIKIKSAIDRLTASYPDTKTKLRGIQCHLGEEATLESNVENLFAQIGGNIDHVVFTAGDVLTASPLEILDLKAVRQAGMVRFFAPIFVAKHAAKILTPGPASSITFTTGAAGDKPVPGKPAVNAYCAGLHGLVRALALDLKPVRVNLVSPSVVDTELWATALGPNPKVSKETIFAHQATKMATGRVGQVEDVVESFLYSMKDRNATGSIIRTDGGLLLL